MELDDLKKQWKETAAAPPPNAVSEAIEKRLSTFESSGRGIRKTFVVEMTFVALIYIGFFCMMWFLNEGMEAYMYKMVIITAIATVPIVWRLYKAQRWINSMDYTADVRTNIVTFVSYFKKTLLMYEWITYVIMLTIFGILLTDSAFNILPLSIKLLVFGYVLIFTLLTRPYIRFAYGRKLSAFEDFLKE